MQYQLTQLMNSSQVASGLAFLGVFLVLTFIVLVALFTRGRVPRAGYVVFAAFIIVLVFAMWSSGVGVPPALHSWFVH